MRESSADKISDGAPRSPFDRTALAFWVAFLVRVAYLTVAHTYRIRPFPDHFEYGWEMGRIARALVTGHGYADPFVGHTGPTAWVTPLYPLLIAFVFKLTGVYTAASAWILLTLNSLFSALTVYPIAAIAQRSFATLGPSRAASIRRWAVWLWALYPAAMQYAVRWVWETSLSTLLFTCAFALALRMHQRSPDRPARFAMRDWVLFGLIWGAIALANPALVLFLPFAGIWILTGDVRALQRGLIGATVSALIFLAVLAPWVVRNTRVFHHFVPLRANFGAELCLGNGPGATGLLMEYDHPAKDPQQLRLYVAMGEYRYAQMRGDAGEADHPGRPLALRAKYTQAAGFLLVWRARGQRKPGHPVLPQPELWLSQHGWTDGAAAGAPAQDLRRLALRVRVSHAAGRLLLRDRARALPPPTGAADRRARRVPLSQRGKQA